MLELSLHTTCQTELGQTERAAAYIEPPIRTGGDARALLRDITSTSTNDVLCLRHEHVFFLLTKKCFILTKLEHRSVVTGQD